jgi:hypothetical protein
MSGSPQEKPDKSLPSEKLSNEQTSLSCCCLLEEVSNTRYSQKFSANYRWIVGPVYERRRTTEFGCSGAAATFAAQARKRNLLRNHKEGQREIGPWIAPAASCCYVQFHWRFLSGQAEEPLIVAPSRKPQSILQRKNLRVLGANIQPAR